MKCILTWVSACVLLLTLTGCPPLPVTLKTIVLSPNDLSYGYQYAHSWSWECDVPQPLPTYGTGPGPVSSGETLVGWYDLFVPGAQPLPCNDQWQFVIRGHVQFDLSQFDAIADATLTFGVDSSESQSRGQGVDQPPQSYATVLGMSVGQTQGENGPYWWSYDNDVTLGGCGALLGCSIDVSNQANQWTRQQHFNYGFILAGPKLNLDSSVPQDNNAQLTRYGNFRLQVLYNPALNPRAPQ